jgi:3-oxoacyl-[acyl-carrier-protein] synthase-3
LRKPVLVKIAGVAPVIPERILSNSDLEKLVETNDQWIVERTGIKTRHIVDPGVATSDLAAIAAKRVIDEAGLDAKDVDLIIVATITADMSLPATACLVQDKIGASKAWGFDLSAACSGFLYALQVGVQFVANGTHKNVIVCGVDVMSTIVDYTDRKTCIIFGDGGGAVLLQPSASEEDGCFIDFLHQVDGSGGQYLCVPGGGSRNPASHETIDQRMHFVKQDGAVVFKFATKKMADLCVRLLEEHNLTGKDLDVFVPHQANLRIIQSAVERMGMPQEKVIINIDRYGNTTAGTIPLALCTGLKEGKIKKGDLVLLAAMGAGFSAGACLLRWAY